jgi:hypothetical protein
MDNLWLQKLSLFKVKKMYFRIRYALGTDVLIITIQIFECLRRIGAWGPSDQPGLCPSRNLDSRSPLGCTVEPGMRSLMVMEQLSTIEIDISL